MRAKTVLCGLSTRTIFFDSPLMYGALMNFVDAPRDLMHGALMNFEDAHA